MEFGKEGRGVPFYAHSCMALAEKSWQSPALGVVHAFSSQDLGTPRSGSSGLSSGVTMVLRQPGSTRAL